MTRQRDAFLSFEGDAWFSRNEQNLASRDWSRDPLCLRLSTLALPRQARVLEIGCGDGSRLAYLARQQGFRVFGADPSQKAVAKAIERGVEAVRSTAEALPFGEASFDAVIFGFCLYLCDDEDLFRIALEADRVLAGPGWLLILDFEAPAPAYRPYHHVAGLESRKMDYKSMFLWHPSYTLAGYEKFHHVTREWTDERDEWVSLACLRKCRSKP
jgi:SAM-dependent methyltransferase